MASLLVRTCLTLNIISEVSLPKEKLGEEPKNYNGKQVSRFWVGVGKKSKKMKIIKHNGYRLAEFENGYVLLCNDDLCNNLMVKCKTHKEDKESYRYCRYVACKKQACYGYEKEKSLYCKDHREKGMIDVKHEKCHFPSCDTRGSFSMKGTKYVVCKKHREEGMVDVTHKKCSYVGCKLRPNFGTEDGKPKFCLKHKDETMVDVIHIKCLAINCETRSTYGYEKNKPKFCKLHKKYDMINVVSRTCSFMNCKIQPVFNFEGERPKYCKEHKLDNMVDVINSFCIMDNCTTRASYAKLYFPGKTHCAEHSTVNEYSLNKKYPICTFNNCNEAAYYFDDEDPNIYPTRCETHKLSTDIKLIEKQCPNCDDTLYYPENQEFCMACGKYRDLILTKFKETIIYNFLKTNNIFFIYNKLIPKGKSKYRPDFLITTSYGHIILEIDEHQHETYDKSKEISRMYTIYNDIFITQPDSQVLFIRYNPDKYKGIQCKNKQRQDYLYTLITYLSLLNTINMKLGVIYLFYDGFDNNPQIQPLENYNDMYDGEELEINDEESEESLEE